ncbi:hypothetical protein M569_03250, partial [Genlisea aurea]
MGSVWSRKRDRQLNEENVNRGFFGRFQKSGSSKWLGASLPRSSSKVGQGIQKVPLLIDLCVQRICKDIDKYDSLSMLPRDMIQLIFDDLVSSLCLTDSRFEAFRDCSLQDLNLGNCIGVNDSWIDVVVSQGSSLLSVDLLDSDITDASLIRLKDCANLQEINFNYCHLISDRGLLHLRGLSSLTALSVKRSSLITSQGMSILSGLVNLAKLDLERCPKIHGGLIHLKGLSKLESLNLNCCNCINDADMKHLSGLINLKSLQIAFSRVTDDGVSSLKDLKKLALIDMEGCPVTASSLETLASFGALSRLNLSRCNLTDDGCDKFSSELSIGVIAFS